MAAATPAVVARPASNPVAVTACAGDGCTETSNLTVPAGGQGETMTDQIPAGATQGSINLQPEDNDPTGQKAFDGVVDTLLTDNPGLIPAKLNQRSKRILTCVYLSYLPFTGEYPDTFRLLNGTTYQALVLDACLQLALSFPNPSAAADATRSGSGPCARFGAAVTLQVTRTRSGYSGVINRAGRPSGRHSATVSCRRSGRGLSISIRPRVRGQKLRKAVGSNLGVAFVNPTKSPVGVRTTFKVN
jgi:hypothetical protein